MNNENTVFVKSYYLPRWRSLIVGGILIIFGLAINLIGIDLDNSVWENLQWIFLNFSSLGQFFFSLLALVFKLGFVIGGYFYVKYSDKVERARLDDKGFYYREIPNGSRMDKLAIDTGKLSFTAYHHIKDIAYKKNILGRWAALYYLKRRLKAIAGIRRVE